MQNNEESLSILKLRNLIKQNKNEEFKSIVLSVDRSDLINMRGETLLHTAAAANNIPVITFLCGLGFDVNAQNDQGKTPLHLAVLNSNFQAVQLLLSIDADILIGDDDGNSTLRMSFQEDREVPECIISNFLQRLSRYDMCAQEMADELEKLGCSIYQVLGMNNFEVTGVMLNKRTSIEKKEFNLLLDRAMNSNYPKNIGALLNNPPKSKDRIDIFVEKVNSHPKKKIFLRQVLEENFINPTVFVRDAVRTFILGSRDEIQVYLDVGFDDFVRKEVGRELFAELFGNRHVDYLEIIKNRNFNINGLSTYGRSALHIAVICKDTLVVVYLLNNGADPNIQDDHGKTPLFNCRNNDEIADLLIDAGADVQAVNTYRYGAKYNFFNKRILAEISMLEARGSSKQPYLYVYSVPDSEFKSYRQDIEWMKSRQISKSFTLFSVLSDGVVDTARSVKSANKVEDILKVSRKRALQPIYVSMLTKKLEKALKFNELRVKAAVFLCNVMNIGQSDHLVIEKIMKFLTFYKDLLVFDMFNIE